MVIGFIIYNQSTREEQFYFNLQFLISTMKFTQVFTAGLFALSTQAAAIPKESNTEVNKRLDAGFDAEGAADLFHLIQLGGGVGANVSVKRDESADTVEESKRFDANIDAEGAADFFHLVDVAGSNEANISV